MDQKQNHRHICDLNLHAREAGEYGSTYQVHLLEQYKVVIQGIDYTSKWKHIVNNYFLTINTILLAAIGLSAARDQISMPTVTHEIVPVIGVFVTIAWWITARGYNDVLEAKFSILHCVEEHLPLALYKTEWEILKAFHKNPNRLARVDASVPLIFASLYLLVFFFVK